MAKQVIQYHTTMHQIIDKVERLSFDARARSEKIRQLEEANELYKRHLADMVREARFVLSRFPHPDIAVSPVPNQTLRNEITKYHQTLCDQIMSHVQIHAQNDRHCDIECVAIDGETQVRAHIYKYFLPGHVFVINSLADASADQPEYRITLCKTIQDPNAPEVEQNDVWLRAQLIELMNEEFSVYNDQLKDKRFQTPKQIADELWRIYTERVQTVKRVHTHATAKHEVVEEKHKSYYDDFAENDNDDDEDEPGTEQQR